MAHTGLLDRKAISQMSSQPYGNSLPHRHSPTSACKIENWDGIAIGGSTAASLQELGDFYLSPYRIYAPQRINPRVKSANFAIRKIDIEDVTWIKGLPVTRPERTLVDLCLDNEEWSLVEDAFNSASNLNFARLEEIVACQSKRKNVQDSLSIIHALAERTLKGSS